MKTNSIVCFASCFFIIGGITAQTQTWLTNGLVGYFPFNRNANDESGNGHNAAVVGSGTQLTNGVNGAPNSAYRCAPGINFIQGSGINLLNSSLSIALWFKKDYTNYNAFEHGGLVRLGELGAAGGQTGKSLHIQVNYSGAPLRFTFFDDNFDVVTPVGNGRWSHIACTFDSVTRERRIYVDGSLIASNIAVRGFSGGSNFDFNPGGVGGGFMDQVRFYNRVLTPSEVQAVYAFEKNPPSLAVNVRYPPDRASFCSGASIVINAEVTNSSPVTKVEFFAGDVLLGQSTTSPYNFTWGTPPLGDYWLRAKVTDAEGKTATSRSVPIAVSTECGQVAIVCGVTDPEIDLLQTYLFDVRLSSHVYYQGMLTAQVLKNYKLIIWDDLGQGGGALEPGTIDALYAAFTNGIPLFLIGERLASTAANLPEPQRSRWAGLTHLTAATGRGGSGSVVVQSSVSHDPFLSGPYGMVGDFAYPAGLDLATNLDVDVDVVGRSGGADVLLAYPGLQVLDTGQTRSFTQNLRVISPEASGSTELLRGLFENVVTWLLRAAGCIDTDLYLEVSTDPVPAQVGQELRYEVRLIRGGECEAIGVVVTSLLPLGVQFVRAEIEQGTWNYDPLARQLTVFVGYVGLASHPQFKITVVPVIAGTITNVFQVRNNGQDANPENNLTAVVTEVRDSGLNLAPRLSIQLTSPQTCELRLTGAANVTYEVQASADLNAWARITNAVGPVWTTTSHLQVNQFYRARIAP